MTLRRLLILIWVAGAVALGMLLQHLAEQDHASPLVWSVFALVGIALAITGYKVLDDRPTRAANPSRDAAENVARQALQAGMPDIAPPQPGTAQALQEKLSSVFERIPLEQQIGEFAAAGLPMLPGRTLEELLISWPRDEYESDPYQLLLFSYAGPVEREPFTEWFTGKGWNWDTECIGDTGSYVTVLREFERLTGEQIFTELSDDAHYASGGTAHITYAIKAGETRKQSVELNHDWADTKAVFVILSEMERAVGDDRHFYWADNGQAMLIYFITDEVGDALNKLRADLVIRLF